MTADQIAAWLGSFMDIELTLIDASAVALTSINGRPAACTVGFSQVDTGLSLDDDPASLSNLTEAGHRAHLRMAARKGARRESVSPVKISSRPVMRIHPGAPGWVRQLEQVESLGGRVEVF